MKSAQAAEAQGGKDCSALKAAQAAEAKAAAYRETPAQKRQRIAELQERARLFGDPVKQSAQAKVLERKWLRFLLVHGEEYGFDERKGPTVELVEHFVVYCFCTRDRVSAIDWALGHGRRIRVADSVHAGEVCLRVSEVQGMDGA